MGMFDWLMDIFEPPKPKKIVKKPPIVTKVKPKPPKLTWNKNNKILVDKRQYPLLYLNKKSMVCSGIDDSIAPGMFATVTVVLNDEFGKFTFTTKVYIERKSDPNFIAEFVMLMPNIGNAIDAYNRNKGC